MKFLMLLMTFSVMLQLCKKINRTIAQTIFKFYQISETPQQIFDFSRSNHKL